jgi:hypothetical protein
MSVAILRQHDTAAHSQEKGVRILSQETIHNIAQTFLNEYLAKSGSTSESVQLSSVAHCTARHLSQSQSVAATFVKEHLKKRQINGSKQAETARYETEVPDKLILARRRGNVVSFFYGWKSQRPVFTHAQHLAQVVDPATSEELIRMLRVTDVDVTALPAPELRKGSL